jgi:uncharacterized protein YecE (DUF72 family)
MGRIFIGTSGYDYPEWRGVFYPASLKRQEYLPYYASQFNALELNFSYYAMPEEKNMAVLADRTEGRVFFSVKGNRQFTHCREIGKWRDMVRQFRDSLRPLLKDNLLLSVLLQFPQSFHYEEETRRYLARLIDEFGEVPLVVEFRHNSWQRQAVYDGLSGRRVGLCLCDMPAKPGLPSFKPVITGDSAYIRFHGRNDRNWYGTDVRLRYEYLYTDEELSAYVPALRLISEKSRMMPIFFNNHAKGNAAANAQKLMALLEDGPE